MHKKQLLVVILDTFLLVVTLALTYFSIKINIFENIYVFTALALVWVLDLIAICASIHYYHKINIMGKIIAVVMTFVVLSITIFIYSIDTNLDHMKSNQDAVVYALYTNDETNASDIAFLELGNRIHDQSIRMIIREKFPSLSLKAYDSIETLHHDLVSNKVDGFLCLDSYFDILEDYDKNYDLAKNYHPEIKYRYDDKRTITAEDFKGLYTIMLTSNYSDLTVKELGYSNVNKLVLVNPDNHKIGVVNIPYDYFIKQACLNQRYDIIANSNLYGLTCEYVSLADHFETDIDFYLKLNFEKLAELIDHLGGLEINNPMVVTGDKSTYQVGNIELNGEEILDYLKIDDGFRFNREEIVIDAALAKIHSLSIIKYIDYLDDIFETNLDSERIKSLLNDEYTFSSFDIKGKNDVDFLVSMGVRAKVHYPLSSDVEDFKEFEYKILN